jgi:hypothetical protein
MFTIQYNDDQISVVEIDWACGTQCGSDISLQHFVLKPEEIGIN